MINIQLGNQVPIEQRVIDMGFSIQSEKETRANIQNMDESNSKSYISFKCRFIEAEGIDYDKEAADIEKALKSMIKLSKSLNYHAKHYLEEFDIGTRVEKGERGFFLVLNIIVVDPQHYKSMEAIVEKLRDPTADERIYIGYQSNFEGFLPVKSGKLGNRCYYGVLSDLQQASKENIRAALVEFKNNEVVEHLVGPLFYLLGLKKLTIEADMDWDVPSLLPNELNPFKHGGLFGGLGDIFSDGLSLDFELPLTTSMKKIATIFRDKMRSDFELVAQISSFQVKLWCKLPNLYDDYLYKCIKL